MSISDHLITTDVPSGNCGQQRMVFVFDLGGSPRRWTRRLGGIGGPYPGSHLEDLSSFTMGGENDIGQLNSNPHGVPRLLITYVSNLCIREVVSIYMKKLSFEISPSLILSKYSLSRIREPILFGHTGIEDAS